MNLTPVGSCRPKVVLLPMLEWLESMSSPSWAAAASAPSVSLSLRSLITELDCRVLAADIVTAVSDHRQ